MPVIVRKSDGAYLYHSTDLAALRHRAETLAANRVLYIVDARQSLHFRQLFALARAAGYGDGVSFEHHPFGTMLGADGRPFKTRHGGGTRLLDLLEEATIRASRLVLAKNPTLDAETAGRIGRVVGVGAVKYADLAKNRTSDYVFNWDAMLALEGNTAPYLQYAYARIQSLFAKAGIPLAAAQPPLGPLEAPEEHALALLLARFQETLEQVAATVMPHHLCSYLYDLAAAFMRFYERCPVLTSEQARQPPAAQPTHRRDARHGPRPARHRDGGADVGACIQGRRRIASASPCDTNATRLWYCAGGAAGGTCHRVGGRMDITIAARLPRHPRLRNGGESPPPPAATTKWGCDDARRLANQ